MQPVQAGYRNKCEFSIAVCRSTNRPVVGFRLGSYEEGEFTVVSADTCAHVPDRMKQLAKVRVCSTTWLVDFPRIQLLINRLSTWQGRRRCPSKVVMLFYEGQHTVPPPPFPNIQSRVKPLPSVL